MFFYEGQEGHTAALHDSAGPHNPNVRNRCSTYRVDFFANFFLLKKSTLFLDTLQGFLTLCSTGTVTFQPVLIKTLVIYLCCAYCARASYLIVIHYYLCSLFVIVIHSFCSLFDSLFVLLFDFILHQFFCFTICCSLF